MNDLLTQLRNRFQHTELELEVEEELQLHIEMLMYEHIQRGMSPEEARAATLKRFGNLNEIKSECMEICSRNRPLQRALKLGAILVFLTGVFVRIGGTNLHVTRIGTTLIIIAVLGRLFHYVRSLSPSHFHSRNKTSSFPL